MPQPSPWHVTSFYKFLALEDSFREMRAETKEFMIAREMMGLVIYAPEGVNGTVAGAEADIAELKSFLTRQLGTELSFKDSTSEPAPFKRSSVVERKEIVGMKRPDVFPESDEDNHLSAKEWHELLASDQPYELIDTRNAYETLVGKFKGATDPNIAHFSHWADYVETREIPKDRPVLIYCTGGIRCEKVMVDLRSRGFENVFQLRDGILGYLAEYPDGFFEGECYVFDDRVAVNANLEPTTRFAICPACGLPSDNHRTCARCGSDYVVCESCEPGWDPVCSKTCQDRVRRHGLGTR